jgi:hypothetical protein
LLLFCCLANSLFMCVYHYLSIVFIVYLCNVLQIQWLETNKNRPISYCYCLVLSLINFPLLRHCHSMFTHFETCSIFRNKTEILTHFFFFFFYKLGTPRIPSIAQCIARRWRYTLFTSERLYVQANKNRQKITEGKLGLPPALVRASRGDPVSPFDETCPAWLNLLAASRRPPV